MPSYLIALVSAFLLFPSSGAFAQELRLPEPGPVAVPAAASASEDAAALAADYDELYAALEAYSNAAFFSPQSSPQFLEASAAGQYLRARLEETAARIERASGVPFVPPVFRGAARVSYRVSRELDGVFGPYSPDAGRGGAEGETYDIRQGYCRVRYVKNNVPFLVQSDAFLKKGEVIITFDDGPGPLTDEVSADMRGAGVPAVFFVLGSKLGAEGKERISREAADGHSVAVHGYWHATESGKPLTAYTTGKIVEQFGGVKNAIRQASGSTPAFFRPPYGIITPEAVKALDSELGLVPVGWTVDTLDWSTKDPEQLFQNTISLIQRRGKGIVLMHDIHPQSRTAVKRLVKWLAENGYKTVSPDRLARAYRGR
ncbi:MAG: polysaccharide deacetylase family protein [Elusimicrobia bacterium]|nr:polysaccharide deacetylase family protein [Elusimicrobiota bacterium]